MRFNCAEYVRVLSRVDHIRVLASPEGYRPLWFGQVVFSIPVDVRSYAVSLFLDMDPCHGVDGGLEIKWDTLPKSVV